LPGHLSAPRRPVAGAMAAPRPPALLLFALLALQVLLHSRPSRGEDAPPFPDWLERLYPGLGSEVSEVCEGSFDVSVHWAHVSRCARVTGSLAVTGILPDVFTTREPYNRVLWTVDGDVLIERNALLTSLRGAFPGLARVGGNVRIVDTALVHLAGFESLREVTGAVLVADNARMLAFKDGVTVAFPALLSVGGSVVVSHNAAEELDGFRALRRVGVGADGGGVTIGPSVDMRYVVGSGPGWHGRKWGETEAFPSLEYAGGDVEIIGSDGLRNVKGAFRRLMRAAGTVRIEGNTPALAEVSDSFSLLDYAGGDVRVRGNTNLVMVSQSFVSLRAAGGDLSIDDCESLVRVEGGTFNRVQWLSGSLIISKTGLRSLSFLYSLANIGADIALSENANLNSLDGLQNLRFVGRGYALQGLEGNFGRCGAISERYGVSHQCHTRQYRFCQPLSRSPALSVPGWYRCVDSIATKLLTTPELKTTAALAQVSGQMDSLQTPAAALTIFAPTDVGWLRSVGRIDAIRLRAEAAQSPNALPALLHAHTIRGLKRLSDLHDGEAPHTLAFGIATRIVVHPGLMLMSPTTATRCRARSGAWSDCSPTKLTRKISLEPLRWIENGVARGVEGGMSTDELLDAYQRGVLAAGKVNAEEDDETVDVEAPKDFDHEKAASEGAKATSWAEHARAAAPSGARVVLGDIKAGNGYVHVIDAAMAAEYLLAPPPAPAPRAPPSPPSSVPAFQVLLLTSPPPPAGLALNAPPPVLTPISTYFATPSPPPLPPFGGSSRPPPLNGPRRGSCKAQAPNICGLCDYTFKDDGGGCCCDTTCALPENDDCCEDYVATCTSSLRAREDD